MAYRIGAPLQAMEAPRTQPPPNRARLEAKTLKLPPSHNPMLPPGKRGNSGIHSASPYLRPHIGHKCGLAGGSPPWRGGAR